MRLNCFSPPVMLATLIIESVLAVYTIWRYKLDVLGRLAVVLLVSLAAFQLCEYHVCTGYGNHAVTWSRFGFVAITALPAVGLHLAHVLAGKKQRRLVLGGYLLMVGFMTYFLAYHAAFIGYKCTGNYVIFQLGPRASFAYGLYYYGLIGAGIGLGFYWIKTRLVTGLRQKTVEGLILGYFVFLVPVALAMFIKPETRRGIPSVMCGFAVLFALILTLYIMPRAHRLDKPAG